MRRTSAIFLPILLANALTNSCYAAEPDYVAADRLIDLALKLCLARGSEVEVKIVGADGSLDAKTSVGSVNIKRSEAKGLIGGLSPSMTAVLASQTSEARSCTVEKFSYLSQMFWTKAGSATLDNAGMPPMIRYVDGDKVETTVIGQISAGRDVLVCFQNRDPWEEGDQTLTITLVRAFKNQEEVVNQETAFQRSDDICQAENKSGRSMRAHTFDAGQYAIVSRTKVGDNGIIAFFDYYLGRPMRRILKFAFGFPYVNIFTLEIRVK